MIYIYFYIYELVLQKCFGIIMTIIKPGDRFQYVNVLNVLNSCFSLIDTTNDVANKQLPVFMFKIPDDTSVKRFLLRCCIFG